MATLLDFISERFNVRLIHFKMLKQFFSPSLESVIRQYEQQQQKQVQRTLPYLIFNEQSYLFCWYRIQWPLISAIWIFICHTLFWSWLSQSFPLMDPVDFYFDFQLFFICSLVIHAGIDTIKVDRRREPHLESVVIHPMDFLVLFLSSLPFLSYIIQLGWVLARYDDRVLGVHDCFRIFLWLRLPLLCWVQIALARQNSRSRIRMRWYHWCLPPLVPLSLLALNQYWIQSTLWIFPMAFGAEIVSFYLLQLLRLDDFNFLKVKLRCHQRRLFKKSIYFMVRVLGRVGLRLPILIYHFVLLWLFHQHLLSANRALLLHTLQPLMQLGFQFPNLFWKEYLDYQQHNILKQRLGYVVVAVSIVWFFVFLTFPWISFLGFLIPLQYVLLPLDLGMSLQLPDVFLKFKQLFSSHVFYASMASGFWVRERKELAIKELQSMMPEGTEIISEGSALVIRWSGQGSNNQREKLAQQIWAWGSGWILELKIKPPAFQTDRYRWKFYLETLRWGTPTTLSELKAYDLSLEDQSLLIQRLMSVQFGKGKGKLRLEKYRLHWLRVGQVIHFDLY